MNTDGPIVGGCLCLPCQTASLDNRLIPSKLSGQTGLKQQKSSKQKKQKNKEEDLIRITVVEEHTGNSIWANSIWAIGVHKQRKEPALFNNQKSIGKPSQELLDKQPAFLFIDDFMKFSPYKKYDEPSVNKAFDLARKIGAEIEANELK